MKLGQGTKDTVVQGNDIGLDTNEEVETGSDIS